jgi:hypothetical protein
MWLGLAALAGGCARRGSGELTGTWEIAGVLADGQLKSGDQVGIDGIAGAVWGREVWKFERGQVTVERDVLLPHPDGGYTACAVDVTVSAAWKGATLTIPYSAHARSRARANDPAIPAAAPDLAQCDIAIDAGEWQLQPQRGEAWDLLLVSPATGGQLRLKKTGDNPDYRAHVPSLGGSRVPEAPPEPDPTTTAPGEP